MDGVEEKDFFYYRKFVGRPKWSDREFRTLTPKFSENLTGENCKTDSQNNSRELSDAARQSHAPNAYVQMPDSSGAVKENWVKNQ